MKSKKHKVVETILFIIVMIFVGNLARLLWKLDNTNEQLSGIRLENQYCLVGCCEIPGRFSKSDVTEGISKIDSLQTKEEKLEFINGIIQINEVVHEEFISLANSCRRMRPNEDLWLYPYN